ncbi:hypothetical protein PsYK624_128930 [Phanerochaete sordida]|uniref:Uncharacterized protein n=1 Tax=Phanerochaete sordida TaxID=48140 RepID=A0A9P3GM02_9APHY|nr:hypothetical protein PsYK624_128930 [Phanerochaete sordida]
MHATHLTRLLALLLALSGAVILSAARPLDPAAVRQDEAPKDAQLASPNAGAPDFSRIEWQLRPPDAGARFTRALRSSGLRVLSDA